MDSWQWLDSCGTAPTIHQVYALGPLYYHLGTCEHYAAALVLLLEHLGLEARYVPGLTYSVEGQLVDHAWVLARVDGTWYHLDPQLDDNVMRGDTLLYRYYSQGDADFAQHHVWGARLPQPDAYALGLPVAAASAPPPAAEPIRKVPPPDVAALCAQAAQHAAPATAPTAPVGSLPPLPGESGQATA